MTATDQAANRTQLISQRYRQQFIVLVENKQDPLQALQQLQKETIAYLFKNQSIHTPSMCLPNIAHGIVTRQINTAENTIIAVDALWKLNLSGSTIDENSFLNALSNNMHSHLGKNRLLYELASPTKDIQALQEKQNLIQLIASNTTLDKQLAKTADLEKNVLGLWNPTPLLPDYVKDGTYFGGPLARFLHIEPLIKPLNKAPFFLELKAPGINTLFCTIIMPLLVTLFGPEYANLIIQSDGITLTSDEYALLETALKASYYTRLKTGLALASNAIKNVPAVGAMLPSVAKEGLPILWNNYKTVLSSWPKATIFASLYTPLMVYVMACQTYNTEKWFAHLQSYFIDLADYLDHARLISAYLQQQPNSYQLAFPELKALVGLDNNAAHSAEFNQLIGLLKTTTFKGKASKLSYLGRVKCAYHLFMYSRNEFEPLLYAMAKLQMYHGVAQLMHESATKENTFCFAEFVEHGPYIEAIDFWNPMVGQDNAVSNSLMMTPAEKDIILHGPNTGGKTTTIKGLIYNMLLAQTLGIGCASKLVLSPFAQINCFMDIQDDVSVGSSLFDAEVRFATELHNNVQSLKQGEYAFTIADEILRSTSPSKGQACAYQFTKKLAKNSNSMSITVTHYPKLVELATETPNNGFRTFHVEIKRENGKVIRTFKLKEGATSENIAGDILHEHGIFDTTDLAEVERLEQEFEV